MTRRALLVINPASRHGDDDLGAAIQHITEDGYELRVRRPESVEETLAAIRENGSSVDRLIVAGGDGTLHAALPALLDAGLPVGLLPLGTGNDVASALGVPSDLRAAAAVFTGESERRVDVGFVNGVPFLNAVQVGLGAELREHLDGERKRRWGALAYVWAAMETLRDEEPFEATLRLAGEPPVTVKVSHITVANGERFGGRLEVGDDAVLESGQVVVKALKPRAEWSTRAMAGAVLRREAPPEDHVYSFRTNELWIDARPAQAVTADGEPVGTTPLRVHVEAGALRVLAPSAKGRWLQDDEGHLTRAPERLAVDDVLAGATSLEARLEQAAESAAGADDGVVALLRDLRERQHERTGSLRDAIHALGLLPTDPDADRIDLSRLATRVRAALSSDAGHELLARCLEAEEELARRLSAARAQELPEELTPSLAAMEQEVRRARELLVEEEQRRRGA